MIDDARLLRLLSRLTKSQARLEALQTQAKRVLVFRSGQRVTLDHETLLALESADLVRRVDHVIEITQAGQARLKRLRAKQTDHVFRHQHKHVVPLSHDNAALLDCDESPLSRLIRLKDGAGQAWFQRIEIEAGERIRRDFEKTQMRQRVTMSFDPAHIGSGGQRSGTRNAQSELSDSAIGARDRLNAALDSLGPELSGVVLDVCCFLKGLETVETERGWPRRSAKLMLRTALSALSRHYFPVARGTSKRQVRHWGAEGFRPAIGDASLDT